MYWSSSCSLWDVGGEFCTDDKRLLQLNLSPQGSWLRESGVLKILVVKVSLGMFLWISCSHHVWTLETYVKRGQGIVLVGWKDWAERVPYRLFPFIY